MTEPATQEEAEAARLYELNRSKSFPDAKAWEDATPEIRERWIFIMGKCHERSPD